MYSKETMPVGGAAASSPQEADRLLPWLALVRRMRRHWWAAALVAAVGTAASVLFAYTRKPIFKSETLILYREGIRSAYLGQTDEGRDPVRTLGLRLKEMVLSRPRLAGLIDEYKLYPEIVEDRGYVDAVDEMRNHIQFRARDGDTFGLSFEGNDPALVQKMTARLAELLIGENTKNRAAQAEETKEFLDTEKTRLESDLRGKEESLAKFLTKHPEFALETTSTGSGSGAAVRAQRKEAATPKPTDPALLALEREAQRIKERLGQPVTISPSKEPVDPRVREAEQELLQAQRELGDKQGRFTEQHPDVLAARQKVRTAEDRLLRARGAALNPDPLKTPSWVTAKPPTESDRAALQVQLDKVNQQIAAARVRAAKQNNAQPAGGANAAANWIVQLETDWARLTREVSDARERLQTVDAKHFKAEIAASSESSGGAAQMVIIDPAYLPTHPYRGARRLKVGVGAGASLIFALGVALALALADQRIYERYDVERLKLGKVLVVVPRADENG
jgi:protein tyrosine kinase modulator